MVRYSSIELVLLAIFTSEDLIECLEEVDDLGSRLNLDNNLIFHDVFLSVVGVGFDPGLELHQGDDCFIYLGSATVMFFGGYLARGGGSFVSQLHLRQKADHYVYGVVLSS